MNRWRGRISGLAILALVAASFALGAVGLAVVGSGSPPAHAPEGDWQLVVRAANEDVLLRVPLPASRFSLRYRNSVYRSLAEERFSINPGGRMVLVELAADEAAVLAEYYSAERPRPADPGDGRRWRARPSAGVTLDELSLVATEHGRRTLVIDGRAFPLWQLGGVGAPTVILAAEKSR
ncbi:MAG: hypothetical protein M3253_01480 [Chloroflexota bacterium]|nr:hypothetical protein [Chloroflexota bacterium]